MPSDIDIANSALSLLGEAPIASFTQEGSPAAARASRTYVAARDELLRSYRWNFAMRRAILAASPTPPAFGFGARFRLPNDLLHFVGIYDPTEPQQNYSTTRAPWRIEGDWLLFDGTQASIFYVAKQETAENFDPLFANALAFRMAERLAYTVTASVDLVSYLAQGGQRAIKEARMANAIENAQEVAVASDFEDSRYGGAQIRAYRVQI